MNDPIVDDVRTVRDAHAARFNYDLMAIFLTSKSEKKSVGLILWMGLRVSRCRIKR